MANYTDIYQKGSKGDDVVDIQKALIDNGYGDYMKGYGADGSFGGRTEKAVKAFQEANGLKVDGIVGEKTLAALGLTGGTNTGGTNTGGNEPTTPTTNSNGAAPVTSPGGVTTGDFNHPAFAPEDSEDIEAAKALLDQNGANKPGAFLDPYQDKLASYLDKLENRDPFSYDFNSDALYQQYRDQYIQQGQMAMMDTMGQAATMTGGYGNSYAQSVGQQTYNQYLNQLNDRMLELNQMAYDRYQQEGQDLLNMYGIYKGLSDDSYGRYQDELDNWYREDSRLTDNYNTAYGREWDQYSLGYNTAWDEYLTDRSEKFTTEQNNANWDRQDQANAKSDLINLITSTGYSPTDAELKAAGMTQKQAEGYAKAYTDSKTTTSGNGNGNSGTTYKSLPDPGSESYRYIEKAILGATSLADLNGITQEYINMYGEDAIRGMWAFNKKLKELMPTNGSDVRLSSTGGVGGPSGVMRAEIK